jgi:hypothetical protein
MRRVKLVDEAGQESGKLPCLRKKRALCHPGHALGGAVTVALVEQADSLMAGMLQVA